jgi:predicted nucleic acid-binding Zn finger protein
MFGKLFGTKPTTVNEMLDKDKLRKEVQKFLDEKGDDARSAIIVWVGKERETQVFYAGFVANEAWALGVIEQGKDEIKRIGTPNYEY